jgi:subtilisin family serine protease
MSLGAGASTALDNAVAGAISKGITVVVAAGNSNANACNYSPARAANAITVGATGSSDARASYSNFGKCLDIFAPGSSITSAWFTNTTALVTISGTSMASPHVAGVAALFLQRKPTSLPKLVRDSLVANATANKVTSAGTGSPNRLLFSNY